MREKRTITLNDNHQLLFRFLSIPFLLHILGLFFMYSASSIYALDMYGDSLFFLKKQLLYSLVAWMTCAMVSFIPFTYLFDYALLWWIIAAGITGLTLLYAPVINGARRWFSIGGFSIQPSEFFTVITILYVTTFLARHMSVQRSLFSVFMIPFLCIVGISSGILLAQPDFGSTVTLLITIGALFFVIGISYRECLILLGVSLPMVFFVLCTKSYRIMRLMTFLDPWKDPQGKGFQIIQSLLAIGSGKLFGVGLGLSKQKFFYLPMQHTDFIFSIIAEEIGFVGMAGLLGLYIGLLYYGFQLLEQIGLSEARLPIIGSLFFISIKTILNGFVCTGLLPTKGMALPFMSYGGSSLIAQWFLIGIIINAFLAKK